MITPDNLQTPTAQEQTCQMLHELGIAVHRHGYMQLCIGIPYFSQDTTQGISKELYPYISKHLGYSNARAVERSIRGVISDAWGNGDPHAWNRYFPNCRKPPSNKQFIATLAERLN